MNKDIQYEYILFFYRFSMNFITDIKWDFSQFNPVFAQLSKYFLADTKILVAVSGWPDSMLASALIYRYFLASWLDLGNLYFVHCNHKTRVETDEEEEFIRSFFQWLNLSVFSYDGTWHTEDDLRTWRYSAFNQLVQEHHIDYLVTGHNLTDRIESSFMNMVRGAGMIGFLSMRFLDENNLLSSAKILRPLLSFTKKEIENFCNQFEIPYVIDQTNLDQNTSLRNMIRLVLFPHLMDMSNKNTDENCTFFESMRQIYTDIEKIEQTEDIWKFQPMKKSPYRNADFAYLWDIPVGFIDEKVLLAVLKKFNIYCDVSKSTLSDFLQFFKSAKQWYKYINWVYFFIASGKIYIIKAKQNFWEKCIEKQLIIDKLWVYEIGKEQVSISNPDFQWCILRYPQAWDKVWSKSWGEYCINKKIPLFWRNFIPVVQLKSGYVIGCLDVLYN